MASSGVPIHCIDRANAVLGVCTIDAMQCNANATTEQLGASAQFGVEVSFDIIGGGCIAKTILGVRRWSFGTLLVRYNARYPGNAL